MNNEHIFGPSKIVRYDEFKNTRCLDNVTQHLPTDILTIICMYCQMTTNEILAAILNIVGTYEGENYGYVTTPRQKLEITYTIHDDTSLIVIMRFRCIDEFYITISQDNAAIHDGSIHAMFEFSNINIKHTLIEYTKTRQRYDFHGILPTCVRIIRLWQCFKM